MVKDVFMFSVLPEKVDEYLKVTTKVIKPFWESYGCLSYDIWQTKEGSPDFIKEMIYKDEASKEKTIAAAAPKSREIVKLFGQYAVNLQRKSCVQKL
ncbi:MAG: hypothetical protein NTV30_07350 [Chloroflexi bacterium]|nr:hypothetical protein [Chloroflexota bacterium]